MNKFYVATWNTNYGEKVALIWARTIDEANMLALDKGAWPDVLVDELPVMGHESEILFIKGDE